MTKEEVAELIENIIQFFPGFKIRNVDKTIQSWHTFLHDADYIKVVKNFDYHVRNKHFPPTIADLLKPERSGRAIPNYEETKLFLEELENRPKPTKEETEEGLRLCAKALGLGENNE